MKKCGKPAPHKALLLLSVIDFVERGIITDARVYLTDDLVKKFRHNTSTLLGESTLFQPNISHPYYHMSSEPFWQLVSTDSGQVPKISNYSLPNLRSKIAYARFDRELFELLQNPLARATLRKVLITSYIDNQPTLANNLSTVLLALGYITSLIA